MDELKNEQTEQTSHTAEAEIVTGEKDGNVSLGKFKDVNALLSAYNSLQSEFTKRCQRIKELEVALDAVGKTKAPETASEKTEENKDTTSEDKEKILKEYLLDVLGKKPKAIVLDGVGVGIRTPVTRPKTIEEAGNLAKQLLEK